MLPRGQLDTHRAWDARDGRVACLVAKNQNDRSLWLNSHLTPSSVSFGKRVVVWRDPSPPLLDR